MPHLLHLLMVKGVLPCEKIAHRLLHQSTKKNLGAWLKL